MAISNPTHGPFVAQLTLQEPIAIIGAGGFAREVLCLIKDMWAAHGRALGQGVIFSEPADSHVPRMLMGCQVLPHGTWDVAEHRIVVAIGDPQVRARVVAGLPAGARFGSLAHPSAWVVEEARLGEGSIVCAHACVTCDVVGGRFVHLDRGTQLGHDSHVGDFFTTAPGAAVSGNNHIGERVYLGTNCCTRQGIIITSDVVIGAGAVVIRDITEPGTYAGVPAKRLK